MYIYLSNFVNFAKMDKKRVLIAGGSGFIGKTSMLNCGTASMMFSFCRVIENCVPDRTSSIGHQKMRSSKRMVHFTSIV